ncbi:hypothetical protein D3C76_1756240 [compost metagenome]
MLCRNVELVIALDLHAHLVDILPAEGIIDTVDFTDALQGGAKAWHIEHQQNLAAALRTGKCRWHFESRHHLSGSSECV